METNSQDFDEKIEELVLLLIYLTSWEENILNTKFLRSWRGYLLDELKSKGLLSGSKGAKSVYLTNTGIKKAKQFIEKYLKKCLDD
ncbi:MAG: DUF6429 family protein [Actinobacteria bacterium]|nr:DUF6429 family protein [Actinomycetota bacterium]